MAHVITEACIKDSLCIDACPTDCIHPKTDEAKFQAANQMYINADECLDCGACVTACTSDAIFPADSLPEEKKGSIEKAAAFYA